MFLSTEATSAIDQIMGETFNDAITEGFLTGIKIFLDGLVQCAIDYPILVIVVVALIILNKKLKKK